jgi:hypothetical protein
MFTTVDGLKIIRRLFIIDYQSSEKYLNRSAMSPKIHQTMTIIVVEADSQKILHC